MAVHQQLQRIEFCGVEKPDSIAGKLVGIHQKREIASIRRPGNIRHEGVVFLTALRLELRKWRNGDSLCPGSAHARDEQ
jgi:hypothetical protein